MIEADPSVLIDNAWVLVLTPIVVGIVQALKALRIPERFAPALTLAVGIGSALIWFDGDWRAVTLTGVVVGLTASGLYSGVTSTQASIQTSTAERAARKRVDVASTGAVVNDSSDVGGTVPL